MPGQHVAVGEHSCWSVHDRKVESQKFQIPTLNSVSSFVICLEAFCKSTAVCYPSEFASMRNLLNFNIAHLPVDASPTKECLDDGVGLLWEIKAMGLSLNPPIVFLNSQSPPSSSRFNAASSSSEHPACSKTAPCALALQSVFKWNLRFGTGLFNTGLSNVACLRSPSVCCHWARSC